MAQPDVSLLLHCSGCDKDLPRGWFARAGMNKAGEALRSSWCRECRAPGKSADAARRRGAGVEKVDRNLVAKLMLRQRRICPICMLPMALGAKLHVDHRVPVSKGGRHVESNLQLCHALCNLKKGAKFE